MLICEREARSPWWYLKIAIGIALIANLLLTGLPSPLLATVFHGSRTVGQLIAVSGGLVHVSHFLILWRAGLHEAGVPRFVEAGGLFRWIRHPMYLGDALLYIGLALIAANPAAAVLLPVGLVAIVKQCRFEDDLIGRRYPGGHTRWRVRTRLLLPGIY